LKIVLNDENACSEVAARYLPPKFAMADRAPGYPVFTIVDASDTRVSVDPTSLELGLCLRPPVSSTIEVDAADAVEVADGVEIADRLLSIAPDLFDTPGTRLLKDGPR
jgi:hypothetical protein